MNLINGDCLEALRDMESHSVDAIVTDPPSSINFMSKRWDDDKGGRHQWIAWLAEIMAECRRVVKPGGHMLCWSLPRTTHWSGMAIEDGGWEIRDCISHVFGSGFPKSLNISKAIDKKMGAEREVIGKSAKKSGISSANGKVCGSTWGHVDTYDDITAPATTQAQQYDGWHTALKPAHELWYLCRAPLSSKNIVDNVLEHGTGAINVDATRVETNLSNEPDVGSAYYAKRGKQYPSKFKAEGSFPIESTPDLNTKGRFPANLVLTHSSNCTDKCSPDCAILVMGEQSGVLSTHAGVRKKGSARKLGSTNFGGVCRKDYINDSTPGTSARFFPQFHPEYESFRYFAKASSGERNDGLNGMDAGVIDDGRNKSIDNPYQRGETIKSNVHPTVKSTSLMRWLCKLITPKGGTILDPFMGSGTTGVAAIQLDFDFIGIEKELEYYNIAKARLKHAKEPNGQIGLF